MNKFYELQVSVLLLKDIQVKDSYESLSKILNYSFNKSEYMTVIHKNKGLKGYSFSGLYPIEKGSVYKKYTIYSFIIRTTSQTINNEVLLCLKGIKNESYAISEIGTVVRNSSVIDYVDCITPAIVTLNNGKRWNKDIDSIDEIKISIENNLLKKYSNIIGEDIKNKDIIKDIEVKSRCGIVINYKNIKMVGYKFRVYFNSHTEAQKIANMSIALGIGEKNSALGMGFVKPYFVRR